LADRRRVEKPYRPCNNPGGGDFWKTLSGKTLAWGWREQHRELMILGMCGQAGFFRCVLENPWESLENPYAQKGNKAVAAWDRLPVGVVSKRSRIEFGISNFATHSAGEPFPAPAACHQEQQARSRAKIRHPLA
jgi:hypothetical protein